MDQEGQRSSQACSKPSRSSLEQTSAHEFFQTDNIQDTSREQLQIIQQTRTHPEPKVLTDLRKRKLITMQKVISFEIKKGPNYAAELVKEETDLTADMIATYVKATHDSVCFRTDT